MHFASRPPPLNGEEDGSDWEIKQKEEDGKYIVHL